MKNLLLLSFVLCSGNAFAAYPFTISGDKIDAIFHSEKLWTKLGGAVETIVFKGHTEGTSKYALTTTESVAVSVNGVTHFELKPCLAIVDVSAKGDEMAPKWEVTNVDLSACPRK